MIGVTARSPRSRRCREGQATEGASAPEQDKSPLKSPSREKRTSKLHLAPVVAARKELPEADRVCGDCVVATTEFNLEPRRTPMYEPSQLFFREKPLVKYACRCCGLGVTMAPATPRLIEGSNVGSCVLAHLVSKVIDATPIERVGRQWARYGSELAPSTMHDWFGRRASEVAFLNPLARRDSARSDLISFDDTPMTDVLARSGALRQVGQAGDLLSITHT